MMHQPHRCLLCDKEFPCDGSRDCSGLCSLECEKEYADEIDQLIWEHQDEG